MINILRVNTVLRAVLVAAICSFSPSLLAQATEQKVWIKAVDNGSQCEVSAYFKGDKDNCNNKKANGREDCAKDEGCVCTRQEKHITWQMDGKESFTIEFDEGDTNPFITTGESDCNFKSNKKGKLRCRVKTKNIPKGLYSYNVAVPHCESTTLQLKVY